MDGVEVGRSMKENIFTIVGKMKCEIELQAL